MRVGMLLSQAMIPLTLLERSQILTLEIFHQRDLERLLLIDFHYDSRHFGETGLHRRPIPTLPGDDSIGATMGCLFTVGIRSHQYRLQHTFLLDRTHQLAEIPHRDTGLCRIGLDIRE